MEINQLPGIIQSVSSVDLIILSQAGVSGPVAVQLPLSGIVNAIGALPLTGGNVTGTTLFGTGTIEGSPYQFQVAVNFDPSAAGASGSTYRKNMFCTTLSYATQDTTNVYEGGLSAFTFVNGPHVASGEINGFHSYFQFNSGSNAKSVEGYESSALNNGTIGSGGSGFINYLGLFNNGASATAASITGAKFQLTNSNSAGGAVTQYVGIDMEAMGGGGSLPSTYLLIRNAEPNAAVVTLGNVGIGSLSAPGAGRSLQVTGADHSGASIPFLVQTDNGLQLLRVDTGGGVQFGNSGLAKTDNSGNITGLSIGNGATSLQVAGAGSWSASGSVATVLGSLGPVGSHTTVQEWLTIKDASGTTRFIPCF